MTMTPPLNSVASAKTHSSSLFSLGISLSITNKPSCTSCRLRHYSLCFHFYFLLYTQSGTTAQRYYLLNSVRLAQISIPTPVTSHSHHPLLPESTSSSSFVHPFSNPFPIWSSATWILLWMVIFARGGFLLWQQILGGVRAQHTREGGVWSREWGRKGRGLGNLPCHLEPYSVRLSIRTY